MASYPEKIHEKPKIDFDFRQRLLHYIENIASECLPHDVEGEWMDIDDAVDIDDELRKSTMFRAISSLSRFLILMSQILTLLRNETCMVSFVVVKYMFVSTSPAASTMDQRNVVLRGKFCWRQGSIKSLALLTSNDLIDI